jgi:hypothetical protein
MRSLLRRYFALLEKKPLQVKIVSALVIFSVSDTLAQGYEHWAAKKEEKKTIGGGEIKNAIHVGHSVKESEFVWDAPRTFRMAAFGGLVNIWIHFWWGILERKMETIICSKTHRYKNAIVKVMVDQSFGTPVYNTIFFASEHALQGHNPYEIYDAVTSRLPTQLARHYTFWPFVHVFNFSFVSVHKRVIVQNVLTVGWAAYLSRCEKEFDDIDAKIDERKAKPLVLKA